MKLLMRTAFLLNLSKSYRCVYSYKHIVKHPENCLLQYLDILQITLFNRAAARIMEEHKRNMETVNNQLAMSKLRQQKQ